jgi:hypothetical protein
MERTGWSGLGGAGGLCLTFPKLVLGFSGAGTNLYGASLLLGCSLCTSLNISDVVSPPPAAEEEEVSFCAAISRRTMARPSRAAATLCACSATRWVNRLISRV